MRRTKKNNILLFADFVAALERKISIRANREVLVQKGILLPESPVNLSEFLNLYFIQMQCIAL